MSSTSRRKLISGLSIFLATLVLLELLLTLTDPLGVNDYTQSLFWTTSQRLEHPTGYKLPEGTHTEPGYRVTILPDGERLVPDTTAHPCRIVFIGDSVTFGMGVDDDETFVNYLAPVIDAELVNTGRPGYDTLNLSAGLSHYEADGYVYLIVDNDWTEPTYPYEYVTPSPYTLSRYISFLIRSQQPVPPPDFTAYQDTIQAMKDANVLVFAFEGSTVGAYARNFVEVHTVPPRRFVNAPADRHPNPKGHREIADAMRDPLHTYVEEVCP